MARNNSFGKLPTSVKDGAVVPMTLSIPEEDLQRMKKLLELSTVATPCYENSLPDGSRHLGIRREWLLHAKETWEQKFDWRQHESYINSFANFYATVPFDRDNPSDDRTIKIHFAAMFSDLQDATTVLLLHGWPGSFLEFLPMLSMLSSKYTPQTLPYNIIVPSLPGYTLSDAPPINQDFGMKDIARILDTLVVNVLDLVSRDGNRGYIVQGGDVGSGAARMICAKYPSCIAAHLNYCAIPEPPADMPVSSLTAAEQKALERFEWFKNRGAAYAMEQATKPGTLGLVLASSPLAALAWISEKFLDWTDPASFSTGSESDHTTSEDLLDNILTSVSLYYLTSHVHTPWHTYREARPMSGPPRSHASPELHIHAPKRLGFSYFPMELAPMPKSWVATTGNLVFWRQHEVGGHFAAMEQPRVLLADLEDFVKEVLAAEP